MGLVWGRGPARAGKNGPQSGFRRNPRGPATSGGRGGRVAGGSEVEGHGRAGGAGPTGPRPDAGPLRGRLFEDVRAGASKHATARDASRAPYGHRGCRGVQGEDGRDAYGHLAAERGDRPASVPHVADRLSQAPGSREDGRGHAGQPRALTQTDPSMDGGRAGFRQGTDGFGGARTVTRLFDSHVGASPCAGGRERASAGVQVASRGHVARAPTFRGVGGHREGRKTSRHSCGGAPLGRGPHRCRPSVARETRLLPGLRSEEKAAFLAQGQGGLGGLSGWGAGRCHGGRQPKASRIGAGLWLLGT